MDNVSRIVIKNIYYMLTYAFRVLNQLDYERMSAETFDNIHDLFAAILAKGITQQLKRGLYREYIENADSLSVMHGKIDVNGTIRALAEGRKKLFCEFDELSENNVFNQILKTTALILIKEKSVRDESKHVLKKAMMFFSGVEEINPFFIRWDTLRFNRNNQSYRMLLSICQLVLEGLLMNTEKGIYKLANFLDDQSMFRLYERFLYEFYNKEVPEVKVRASKIKWLIDEGIGTFLPGMQTDVVLTRNDKTLIIDAKYYTRATQNRYGKQTIHSHNIYQIYAYVKNYFDKSVKTVSGMLLYARTNEEVIPDMDVVLKGNRISTKTLDLNCEFDVISSQLKNIAYDYLEIGT